jgi:DNA (cytosine-5)-methyltransferase 1
VPTFGSLFAGIGGIDLGLERAGWECRWQVENDPYCTRVLAKHWPDVERFGDIRALTGAELAPVDLVAGGFPCQPVSLAGRRRGAADSRWLWPEFARLLGVLRPRLALLENVPGLLAGPGMAEVLGDLAALGFDAEWHCVPAAAVGAPHLRWRVFIVAHAAPWNGQPREARVDLFGARGSLANTDSGGWREGQSDLPGQSQPDAARSGTDVADTQDPDGWRPDGPDDPGRGNQEDGGRRVPGDWAEYWLTEPDVGRVAHGVPSRVDRLRCLGNAVVPQVAEWVGRMMLPLAADPPGSRDQEEGT